MLLHPAFRPKITRIERLVQEAFDFAGLACLLCMQRQCTFVKPIFTIPMYIRLYLFCWLCLPLVAAAQLEPARMDSLLQVLAAKNKSMGSLAIVRQGKTVYTRATGFIGQKNGQQQAASPATLYRIGSVTKVFTAVMIFQLIEEGKLSLDTRLSRFYPGLPHADSITIEQMLGHRSGLYSVTSDPDYLTWCQQPQSEAEILARIQKGKPDFAPDTKSQYSNSNYILLGYILEKVGKKPYAKALQKRICKRIGLKHTRYGKPADAAKSIAASFKWHDEQWKQDIQTDMSIPHGAGAIMATAEDIARFGYALFHGQLVSQASLDRMKAIRDGMGLGLFQFPFNRQTGYGHTGGIDGFASNWVYFPEEDLSVMYCTNGHNHPLNDVMIGVLLISMGKPYRIPTFETIAVPVEALEQYVGTYAVTTQIPLPPLTIFVQDGRLFGQGQGQKPFPLDAVASDVFRFDRAGIEIRFAPAKDELTLKQGPGTFVLKRQKN